MAAGEAAAGRWRRGAAGSWGARAAAALRGASRARLARLGVRRGALPSELLARADRERIAALVWGPAPPPPPPRPLPPPPALDLADALVKAALCEVLRLPIELVHLHTLLYTTDALQSLKLHKIRSQIKEDA